MTRARFFPFRVFLRNHTDRLVEVDASSFRDLALVWPATGFPRKLDEVSEALILDVAEQNSEILRRDKLVAPGDLGPLHGGEWTRLHIPPLDGPGHSPFEGSDLGPLSPSFTRPVFKVLGLRVPQTEGRVLGDEALKEIGDLCTTCTSLGFDGLVSSPRSCLK